MEFAFADALQEITLCLFTTLAPASVLACLLVGFPLLSKGIDYSVRYSVNKAFAGSLGIASIGLVASATHLGNPSNALYVFFGIGRSPLSNEVIAASAFLLCAALFWLVSFAEKHHIAVTRILYGFMIVTGAVFINAIAFAYNVETIITWTLPYVPLSIFLNALFVGPLLGVCSLCLSKRPQLSKKTTYILIGVSIASYVGNVVNYFLQGTVITHMGNYMFSISELSGCYWLVYACFCLLGLVALGLFVYTDKSKNRSKKTLLITACVLAFLAVFVMRFMFYVTHITAGLGM